MKKFISISIIASVLFGFIILNYSCTKPINPKAIVEVIDENNEPIEDAKVSIKAIDSDESHTFVYLLNEAKPIEYVQYTDSEGQISYDFKYESIYKIEVTVDTDRDHPNIRRGKGVLVLENNKTEKATIKVNEQVVF